MIERNHFFDNMKGILIFLVVLGHMIEPFLSITFFKFLYVIIYQFHMPAFVFISGYFSIRSSSKNNKIIKLFKIYMISQVVYILFSKLILKQNLQMQFTTPYWILWFLLSMIFWEIISIYTNNDYKTISIVFIVGIIAGMSEDIGYYMSLSRTIYYFPFFMLGTVFKEEYIYTIKSKVNILILLGIVYIILVYNFMDKMNISWLYGSFSYSNYTNNIILGATFRGLTYLISIFCILVFISINTHKYNILSKIGKCTLRIYLIHGLCIKYLIHIGILNINNQYKLLSVLFLSISIIILLSYNYKYKINESI